MFPYKSELLEYYLGFVTYHSKNHSSVAELASLTSESSESSVREQHRNRQPYQVTQTIFPISRFFFFFVI